MKCECGATHPERRDYRYCECGATLPTPLGEFPEELRRATARCLKAHARLLKTLPPVIREGDHDRDVIETIEEVARELYEDARHVLGQR